MFTKRTILAGLVLAVLVTMPNLSHAQTPMWLYNDSGTPTSVWAPVANGNRMATTFTPPSWGFKTDSLIIAIYRHTAGTAQLSFRVRLHEDNTPITSNGCPGGAVSCNGPGTVKWTSGVINVTQTSGWSWKGVSLPDCVMIGQFIASVEFTAGGNQLGPLMDNGAPVPCCEGYLYFSSAWHEHWDAWGSPSTTGHHMIRVYGETRGASTPPCLTISKHTIFYGHAMINWDGGPEPITQEALRFMNTCGGTDTVNSFTMTNPTDFTWSGNPLPWYLGSGQFEEINVTFQTVTEGTVTGDLVVNHTGANATLDTVHLSGIGWRGHWMENFYNPPDPLNGDWMIQMDDCQDELWAYYSGGYSDQCCQAGHQYSDAGCNCIDWMVSGPFKNPDNAGVKVVWLQEDRFSAFYYYHAFYWTGPDCTQYHWVADIGPTAEGEFVEEGPHYVNAPSDSIQIAYLYVGEDADSWFIDDIRADSIEPSPPEFVGPGHEHHSDDGPATWDGGCIHLTCQVLDPNNDPFTVTLYYRDHGTPGWSSTPMWAVTGCEFMNLWEGMMCDLVVCHTYDYYFQADDVDGTSLLPATAPTDYYHVDILDNTKPQRAYDNGTAWYVRYNPTYWEERFAVRFTPASYPYSLGGAMVMLGAAAQAFPDADHEDIVAELYDDNGASGSPGTLIGSAYPDNGTSWNEGQDACDDTTFAKWVYVKIDPCVTITDGDFYIAVRNRDGSMNTDKEAFGYDTGPAVSPYRTWIFYADLGRWGLDTLGDASDPPGASTNLMVRAIQCACVPSAPTNATVYYYGTGTPDSVVLRWTHVGDNMSYKVYRSTTDPFSGFALLGTVAATAGVDSFIDPVGANTKAFYRVTGSCDPAFMAPPVPPSSMSGAVALGPVRRTPSGLRTTLMLGEQVTLEEQLRSGIMPKQINRAELEKVVRTEKLRRISHSWNLK